MKHIIYGKNTVLNALKNRKVYKIYLQEGIDLKLDNKFNDIVTIMSKQNLNNKFKGNHQGIVAEVEEYKVIELSESLNKNSNKNNSLYIVLDQIEDPHNFGSIIRTAEVFGVDGVIIPKNRSVSITDTVIKVSSGGIEYVDIILVNNINNAINTLKDHNYWVVGTDLNTDKSIYDIDYNNTKCAVVIGNEGKGISKLTKKNCDFLAKIPMLGKLNSLNASVSTSIVVSEIRRQQNVK